MAGRRVLEDLRVLVVEDEYFIADDLKGLLMRQGAESVYLSGSVDDAIRKIQDHSFNFGIVDINIQGEMTFRVADELRRRDVPFAFVSGYERDVIPPRFTAVPNWGKPYDDRQIVSGIPPLYNRATGV